MEIFSLLPFTLQVKNIFKISKSFRQFAKMCQNQLKF